MLHSIGFAALNSFRRSLVVCLAGTVSLVGFGPFARTSTVLAQATKAAAGSEWPQFLGPNRNGISSETGLLERWPADGPPVLWRAEAGVGMSGVAVAGGLCVTMFQTEGQQRLVALDVKTGKLKWQTALAPEYRNSMGDGPRGTPAIAGSRVFAFTGEGILVAADLKDGTVQWKHNTVVELGAKVADYGMACSPMVVGKRVIVSVGAPQASLAAYDVESGKLAWKAGTDPAGYSSPALLEVGGRAQVVAFTGGSALGLNPDNGDVLWRYEFATNFDCNIATPLAVDGQVFISSGENHGSVMLALKRQADGNFEAEETWTSLGPKSVLRAEWQTPLLLKGHLYGMDNVGGAGPVTHLTCVNAKTGERVWQVPRFGKGNLIAADGKIFMSTMKGELVVARAVTTGYEEIGRVQLLETTRQAPSLAGGLLYLRDDQQVICVDVRRK